MLRVVLLRLLEALLLLLAGLLLARHQRVVGVGVLPSEQGSQCATKRKRNGATALAGSGKSPGERIEVLIVHGVLLYEWREGIVMLSLQDDKP